MFGECAARRCCLRTWWNGDLPVQRIRLFAAVAWLAMSLLAARTAQADQTFCIDPGHQPTGLFDALVTWRDAVNEQVTVKVVGGTYGIGVSLTQLHDPPASLMLLGGYKPNTNCSEAQRNITANVTVLDGGGNGAFAIEPAAPVWIDGVTFANYYGATVDLVDGPYSGIHILAVRTAVTMTRFILNHVDGLILNNNNGNDDSLVLQDCLIVHQPVNSTEPSLYVGIDHAAVTIRNCTVADNHAGVEMETYDGGQVRVFGTIAFNNDGDDFFVGNAVNTPVVSYSFYDTGSGFIGNSNVKPPPSNYQLFVGPGDYHLAQQSPAINQGDPTLNYAAPLYPGGPNETDLDGGARVQGSRVDIGAYESNFVPNQYVVTKTADDGSTGTLRWAINQVNAHPSTLSTIVFNLGASSGCPYTIYVDAALPDLVAPAFVDARTQPGWAPNTAIGAFTGTLCVHITNGSGGALLNVFHVPSTASGAQLSAFGMIFDGFVEPILLEAGTGHSIGGNRFSGPGLSANAVGVYVTGNAGSTQIGGNDIQFENVFDNSVLAAIFLGNAAGDNAVLNNLIGLAPDGITAIPNAYGVYISESPLNTLRSNYIGYTTYDAVLITGAGSYLNLLQQNNIGWDFFGPMPNGRYGVYVDAGAGTNLIGNGTLFAFNFANTIRYSGAAGVMIAAGAGSGNYVLGNDLVGNGGSQQDNGLAIDSGTLGPTDNSAQNAGNFPLLRNSFALPNRQLMAGTLDAAPNTSYRLDFYHLNTAPVGYPGRGNAGLFAGASPGVTLHTDANGHCAFLVSLSQVQVGGFMSASATALGGNTSEIGNAAADQLDGVFINGFGAPNGCQ